jgi:hypothetical protein
MMNQRERFAADVANRRKLSKEKHEKVVAQARADKAARRAQEAKDGK